jgi:O-antigen/teichoic acid export membrane protein
MLGRLIGAAVQAASMGLLARWSGPTAFGLFAAVYGVAILIQALTDFGLNTYLIRMRAQYPAARLIGGLLRLQTRINITTASVGLAVGAVLAIWNPSLLVIAPMAVWLASDKQSESWLCVSLSDGRAWLNAVSLIARRAGALAILLIAMVCGVDPIVGYALGLAVSSVGSALILGFKTLPEINGWGTALDLSATFRASSHYWVNSLATQARNLDTLIVGAAIGMGAAGLYGAAARLTTPLRMVPTSVATVLMPVAAKTRVSSRRITKAVTLILTASTLFYGVVALATPALIPIVLGEDFKGSVQVIQIVCVGLVFASISSQLNALLQGWGFPRPVAIVSVVSTAFCLGGIVLLSREFGVVGAGAALTLSYVFQTILLLFMIRQAGRRSDG